MIVSPSLSFSASTLWLNLLSFLQMARCSSSLIYLSQSHGVWQQLLTSVALALVGCPSEWACVNIFSLFQMKRYSIKIVSTTCLYYFTHFQSMLWGVTTTFTTTYPCIHCTYVHDSIMFETLLLLKWWLNILLKCVFSYVWEQSTFFTVNLLAEMHYLQFLSLSFCVGDKGIISFKRQRKGYNTSCVFSFYWALLLLSF